MILAFIAIVLAADASKMAESVAKMQAAMEKQRVSVRKQSPGDTAGFYTAGWINAPPADASVAATAQCEPLAANELRKLIVDAATRESVNPLLIRAMIGRESGGRPCAVSAKGAEGLMQLMPATAAELGVKDAFNPADNVSAGARYLHQMLERYKGDVRLALAAYNAGPQRVDDSKGVPSIPETEAYVTSILAELKNLEAPVQ